MSQDELLEDRESVALVARAALTGGNAEAAARAYRRLLRAEPGEAIWWLRLADALEAAGDDADATEVRAALAEQAAAAGEPLPALAAALAADFDDLPERFVEYLAGSEKLARMAPPRPPLPQMPSTVPADVEGPLPEFPGPPPGRPLPPIPLISRLDADAFAQVAPTLSRRALAPGEVLLAEGDTADALYLVAAGRLEVVKADDDLGLVKLGTVASRAVIGEMALVLERPRQATVRALDEAEVIAIGLEGLNTLAAESDEVGQALAAFTRQRILGILLGTSPLFRNLSVPARTTLLAHFTTHDAGQGDLLVSEGDPAGALGVVVEGRVEVLKADETGTPVPVAKLGPGAVFGEIAILSGEPTTASVQALTDCTLLALKRSDLETCWTQHPEIRERLEKLGADRVAENRFIFEDDDFIEIAD